MPGKDKLDADMSTGTLAVLEVWRRDVFQAWRHELRCRKHNLELALLGFMWLRRGERREVLNVPEMITQ